MITWIRPARKEYRVYFFFPFYHTGGAEKSNVHIALATGGNDCIIYFTRRSVNDTHWAEFQKSGCVIKDISAYTDNKWLYFLNLIYRGILAAAINGQKKKALVFNGQCNFAYKISPWINKRIAQIEFIHTFCSFSYIRTPFLPFYAETISASHKTINDHLQFYQKIGVPGYLHERFVYRLYAITLPEKKYRSDYGAAVLKALFVGRGTYEKRASVFALIARQAAEKKLPFQFEIMGDARDAIPAGLQSYCYFHGNKSDINEINNIYRSCHILIVTSLFEGFPFAVMEAMSHGLAILSTPVGDVPFHVKDHINGFIFLQTEKEDRIVSESMAYLDKINKDREWLAAAGKMNMDYSFENFNLPGFYDFFQQLFRKHLNGQ